MIFIKPLQLPKLWLIIKSNAAKRFLIS